jgi:serine/threonine protein kinase
MEESSLPVRTDSFEQMPGGRYEIVARLGTGAFGSVYRAQDTFLNRPVAVKSIRLDTTLDPEHRKALNKRFIREAQVRRSSTIRTS